MKTFEKLKQYLIGKEDEEVSWLLYFLVSLAVSGIMGVIVQLIHLI